MATAAAATQGRTKRKPVVADVAAAMALHEARVGKTIRLRATKRGFYGVHGAAANIVEPGSIIAFAVKDLEPFKGGEYADGMTKRQIDVEGKSYALPSWLVDPNDPIEGEEFEDEPDVAAGTSRDEDVI